MSPDEVLRKASQLLRSGTCPAQEFVDSLDAATQRAVGLAIRKAPARQRGRDNAQRIASASVWCVQSGGRGDKIHAVVHRRGLAGGWPACGVYAPAAQGGDAFRGKPTCQSCLQALMGGSVAAAGPA